jgi:NADPH2:quinone reductase
MRALVCPSWRDWDALELRDIAAPVLRPGAIRLRVEAVGVSFASRLVVQGRYQRRPPLPFVPGTEVVGTVLEGPIRAGTRVFAALDWGGMAEEAVVDAIHCTPIPDGLDAEAAVAFPISYPTAAAALMWRGRVRPGDWVLVQGAAGGVGLAGLEVAKALGCRVAARAAPFKHDLLRARGADLLLDSGLPFRDAVRAAAPGSARRWPRWWGDARPGAW